jgi:hypothetical protein
MNLFKKIFVPNGSKEIIAYESWTVRWRSARDDGGYSTYSHMQDEAEVFTTKEDANGFKDALERGFKLAKDTNRGVTITKN